MNLFRMWPVTDAVTIIGEVEKNLDVLAPGCRIIGKSRGKKQVLPFDLLLASPEGEAVACLAGGVIDSSMVDRAKEAIETLEASMPMLNILELGIETPLRGARALILGGILKNDIYPIQDPRIQVFLFSVVPNQPGPPFLFGDPQVSLHDPSETFLPDEVNLREEEIEKLAI